MPLTLSQGAPATDQSFAALGVTGPRLTLLANAVSTLTFTLAGRSATAARLWAFDEQVILKRDGVIQFVGRVQVPDDDATGRTEDQRYTVASPWQELTEIPFEQTWRVGDGGSPSPAATDALKSRLILFADELGNKLTTVQQLTEILDYAIAAGAGLQLGTIDALAEPPTEEATDLSCAEAILRCLRWTPDAVAWFDFATTPPTLHIRRRADLAAATLDLAVLRDPSIEALNLRPRHDLIPRNVRIKYERTHSVDAVQWEEVTLDEYPPALGVARRTLALTPSLKGFSATTLAQKIKTAQIAAKLDGAAAPPIDAAAQRTWWQRVCPELVAPGIADIEIDDATVQVFRRDPDTDELVEVPWADESRLLRFVIEGAIAEWMHKRHEEYTVQCDAEWTRDGEDQTGSLTARVLATNTLTGTYRTTGSLSPAEPVPTGLAEAFYTALATLHFEGQLTVTETEVGADFTIGIGHVLNLATGRAEWAAMRAFVTQVALELATGQTTITVGPPPHLAIADLIEQQRVQRNRQSADWVLRQTGQQAGGGEQELPVAHADHFGDVAPTTTADDPFGGRRIRFGHLREGSGPDYGPWTGEPKRTLIVCDVAGVDKQSPTEEVEVWWFRDQSGMDPQVDLFGCQVLPNQIIPFTKAADGEWYICGDGEGEGDHPTFVIIPSIDTGAPYDPLYEGGCRDDARIVYRGKFHFGWFHSTVSCARKGGAICAPVNGWPSDICDEGSASGSPPSGGSPSGGSPSGGSPSGGSPSGGVCSYLFESVYDCDTETWSQPDVLNMDCNQPATDWTAVPGQPCIYVSWVIGTSPCTTGLDCSLADTPACDAPAFTPDTCCGSPSGGSPSGGSPSGGSPSGGSASGGSPSGGSPSGGSPSPSPGEPCEFCTQEMPQQVNVYVETVEACPSAPDPNGNFVCDQLPGEPCRYVFTNVGDTLQVNVIYGFGSREVYVSTKVSGIYRQAAYHLELEGDCGAFAGSNLFTDCTYLGNPVHGKNGIIGVTW